MPVKYGVSVQYGRVVRSCGWVRTELGKETLQVKDPLKLSKVDVAEGPLPQGKPDVHRLYKPVCDQVVSFGG